MTGGDFNATPQDAIDDGDPGDDFVDWRAAYDELDEVAPFAATHDDGRKIDYVWARDAGAVSSPYAVVTDLRPESDHKYYSGRFLVEF